LEIRRRLLVDAQENADYRSGLSVPLQRLGNLAVSDGDPAAARRYYEESLSTTEPLARAVPESAEYARRLWFSYAKLAHLAEEYPSTDDARSWWRRAYEELARMKQRGMFVSSKDEDIFQQIKAKLGLP
jgi:hypothetical protein